jgi:SAM-dependent methyltransferase
MVRRLLHRLLSFRLVDQTIQTVLGSGRTRAALEKAVSRRMPRASAVLDLGGGAGRLRGLWSTETRYVCLDTDRRKLGWIERGERSTLPVEADGTRLPVRSGALDAVVCRSVFHHLTRQQLSRMLEETSRVLGPAGVFFLIDPVRAAGRPLSSALWRLDRGSFPRTREEIEEAFRERFEILEEQRIAFIHEYVLLIGAPAAGMDLSAPAADGW